MASGHIWQQEPALTDVWRRSIRVAACQMCRDAIPYQSNYLVRGDRVWGLSLDSLKLVNPADAITSSPASPNPRDAGCTSSCCVRWLDSGEHPGPNDDQHTQEVMPRFFGGGGGARLGSTVVYRGRITLPSNTNTELHQSPFPRSLIVSMLNVGGIERNPGPEWPCGVCVGGVGRGSYECGSCNLWFHSRCSGLRRWRVIWIPIRPDGSPTT